MMENNEHHTLFDEKNLIDGTYIISSVEELEELINTGKIKMLSRIGRIDWDDMYYVEAKEQADALKNTNSKNWRSLASKMKNRFFGK